MTYVPRAKFTAHTTFTPQSSSNLASWSAVNAGAITNNNDGSFTVRLPVGNAPLFLRLNITVSN
jgi:hypothetical protein